MSGDDGCSAQRDARPRPDVISAASKMFAASLRAPVDAVRVVSPRRVVSPSRRRSRARRLAVATASYRVPRARPRPRPTRPRDRPRTPPHQHHSRAPRGDVCGGHAPRRPARHGAGFRRPHRARFPPRRRRRPRGARPQHRPAGTHRRRFPHPRRVRRPRRRRSGERRDEVSAVGGAENVNIRTSRTCTLNSRNSPTTRPMRAILAAAERLLPDLRGLAASKHAFKVPTSGSPFSYELPRWRTTAAGISRRTRTPSLRTSPSARGYQRRRDGARVPQRRRRGRR